MPNPISDDAVKTLSENAVKALGVLIQNPTVAITLGAVIAIFVLAKYCRSEQIGEGIKLTNKARLFQETNSSRWNASQKLKDVELDNSTYHQRPNSQ